MTEEGQGRSFSDYAITVGATVCCIGVWSSEGYWEGVCAYFACEFGALIVMRIAGVEV